MLVKLFAALMPQLVNIFLGLPFVHLCLRQLQGSFNLALIAMDLEQLVLNEVLLQLSDLLLEQVWNFHVKQRTLVFGLERNIVFVIAHLPTYFLNRRTLLNFGQDIFGIVHFIDDSDLSGAFLGQPFLLVFFTF